MVPVIAILLATGACWGSGGVYRGHGMALHGELKYGPGFAHVDYVDPNAFKGGEMRLGRKGTFDTLNPFILKGVGAPYSGSLPYDSLLGTTHDEPFSAYGLLAKTIAVPDDNSWVLFELRPEARWHDGQPITPEDVIFSFELLRTQGHPFYRDYYAAVDTVIKVGDHGVKFAFGGEFNRELPLIVGQFGILPRHYWRDRDFGATTLEPPLGSGPYRIAALEAGRFVTFARVADYWGRELPINRGRYNFDRFHIDFYRDETVLIEALKAGEVDVRQETSAKAWATAYDIAAVAAGRLILQEFPHQRPTGMKAFWFNTRRGNLADRRVRQALAYAFDFEWTNATLFHGLFARTTSFFSNSELASVGLPSGRELEILEEYRGRIPAAVFTTPYQPPATNGSGQIRANLRTARNLLAAAGWRVVDNALVNTASGERLALEFMLHNSAAEQYVIPMIGNLERLGVAATVRTVDRAQYQQRVHQYDFDIVVNNRGQSESPGNEQTHFWHSSAAQEPGSSNLSGIADPVVDELIGRLIAAPGRAELVATTRALDRVLLHHHLVIPHWHARALRTVRWDKFGQPAATPPFLRNRFFVTTWWHDAERAARLEANN